MTDTVNIKILLRLTGPSLDQARADIARAIDYHTSGLVEALIMPDSKRRVRVDVETRDA